MVAAAPFEKVWGNAFAKALSNALEKIVKERKES
jgi:hypothetical protein